MVRVKVCCISSVDEAQVAIRAGASAVGLVSAMPTGPGVIDESEVTTIAATIPPALGSFLLTSLQSAQAIITQQRRCRTNTVQIVDRLLRGTYADLRAGMPGVSVVQAIHVTGAESIGEADEVAPHVDAVLLDSGNPALAAKQLGGTGRVHDWRISRQIRERLDVPVFLAGGLRPGNVAAAIEAVRPYGIDVCSGVRSNDRLDPAKLQAFLSAAFAA